MKPISPVREHIYHISAHLNLIFLAINMVHPEYGFDINRSLMELQVGTDVSVLPSKICKKLIFEVCTNNIELDLQVSKTVPMETNFRTIQNSWSPV